MSSATLPPQLRSDIACLLDSAPLASLAAYPAGATQRNERWQVEVSTVSGMRAAGR